MRTFGIVARVGALALGFGLFACGDSSAPPPTTLVVSADTLTVTEGSTATFTVALSAPLKIDGAVTVTVANGLAASVNPQVITFAAGDISAKTITVTGTEDNNLTDEVTSIALSAAGINVASVALTVKDDDTQAIVPSSNTLTLTETHTGMVGAHLAFQPADNTVVTLTSADLTRLTTSPATLTFTPDNYQTDQQVTLTSLHDADIVQNTVILQMTSPNVAEADVTTTITDIDVQGISFSVAALALTEANARTTPPVGSTFQVTLNQQPSANVTLTVTSDNTNAATVSPATVTFTPTDYATGASHVVTVTPVSDQNTVTDTANINFAGGGLAKALPVTVTDVDVQAIVTDHDATAVGVTEGSTAPLNVHLAFDPGAQVTVNVMQSNAAVATALPTALTFDSTNYSTPQLVTVTGVQDDNVTNETTSLMLASTGVTTDTVTVNVTDDDHEAILVAGSNTPLNVTMAEGTPSTPSTFTVPVRLAFRPTANTNITAVVSSSSTPNILTVTGGPLMFTSGPTSNFATTVNLTLTSLHDANIVQDTAIVTLSDGGSPALTQTINVTINDSDVQSFVIVPTSIPTVGEGTSTTFTVAMNFAPSAAVNATITTNDPHVTVNGSTTSTSFTIPASDTPQTITVAVVQDADAIDEHAVLTIHDTAVGSTTPDLAVPVTGKDDDTMAFVLTPGSNAGEPGSGPGTPLSVTEQGAPVAFKVHLTAAPAGTTSVTVIPNSAGVVSVSNVAGNVDTTTYTATTSLTFTPANFNVDQTIMVFGLSDPNLVDEQFAIQLSDASIGAADAFEYMQKIEDDAQAIITTPVAPGPLSVSEGSSGTKMFVHLQFQPATTVQVFVNTSEAQLLVNGVATQKTLLFTTTDYNVDQVITLTTPDDNDQFDPAPGQITVSSPALVSQIINVNLHDDDHQAIVLAESGATIQETPAIPNTHVFGLKLAFVPTAASETVTLTVPGAQTSKIQLCDMGGSNCGSNFSVTFTNATGAAGGWDSNQQVMVASESDVDVNNENVTVTLASNIVEVPVTVPTFGGATVSGYKVQVIDDNTLNLVVQGPVGNTGLTQTIDETGLNNNVTFTAHLNFDPTTSTTITLATNPAGSSKITFLPSTLTFTGGATGNYATDQTFTVTAVADPDVRSEVVELDATSPVTSTVAMTINVTDHDQQSIVFVTNNLQINEGSSAPLTVQLSNEPTLPVTISVATTKNLCDVAHPQTINTSVASVTFDKTNWFTPQTISVSSPEDDNDLDHFSGQVLLAVTSGQTGQELAGSGSASYAVRDNDTQVIVVTAVPTGLTQSVEEGGPSATFTVIPKLPPRCGVADTVLVVAPFPTDLGSVGSNGGGSATFTFQESDIASGSAATVSWFALRGNLSSGFNGNMQLSINESSDQQPQFGLSDVSPTAAQAVRVINDEQTQISSFDTATLNGATEFTERANVAFGLNGTAEGIVGITGRTAVSAGSALIGFADRLAGSPALGPTIATAGTDPTTEIIEFDASGSGSWHLFASDATGIVYSRIAIAGTVLVAKTLIAPVTDNATDFSVARNPSNGTYGVVYRRESTSRNNLYFRSVDTTSGFVTDEQAVTTADTFVHFHPSLMYVGGGAFTTFDPGTGTQLPAPYVAMYSENGTTRLVRMGVNGGPLGTFTYPTCGSPPCSPGTFVGDFAHSIFVQDPFFSNAGVIVSASVHATGTNLGDHELFLHFTQLTSSGVAANYDGAITMTHDAMAPVSPPHLSFNGVSYAATFDDELAGSNQVGVSLWSFAYGIASEYRLTSATDAGVFPSITWAGDRWVLRMQADSPTSAGIHVRTGEFIGAGSPPT